MLETHISPTCRVLCWRDIDDTLTEGIQCACCRRRSNDLLEGVCRRCRDEQLLCDDDCEPGGLGDEININRSDR